MARLFVILLVPLFLIGLGLYTWVKARRFGVVGELFVSPYPPIFAVRCRSDFRLLEARRAPLRVYVCDRIRKTYPAKGAWYALYASIPEHKEQHPARLVMMAAMSRRTLPWASDAATGIAGLAHAKMRTVLGEASGTSFVLTTNNDPWLNTEEHAPWDKGSVAHRMVLLLRSNTLKLIAEYREPDIVQPSGRRLSEDAAALEAFAERARSAFRIVGSEENVPASFPVLPWAPPGLDGALLSQMAGEVLRKRSLLEYLSYLADDVWEIVSYFRR